VVNKTDFQLCALSFFSHLTIVSFSSGNRHLTVFNDQAEIQVGGIWKSQTVFRPFVGVLTNVLYNGVRPLDFAAATELAANSASGDSKGSSDALGDVRWVG
jgi:hypothetical protein